mmetsp:Transcript_34941/g.102455  ORF Transcript_34941/g.102455 Transcript_34941/m.102455 type:complete len:248 (-) Transcript_34941:84-827(-)
MKEIAPCPSTSATVIQRQRTNSVDGSHVPAEMLVLEEVEKSSEKHAIERTISNTYSTRQCRTWSGDWQCLKATSLRLVCSQCSSEKCDEASTPSDVAPTPSDTVIRTTRLAWSCIPMETATTTAARKYMVVYRLSITSPQAPLYGSHKNRQDSCGSVQAPTNGKVRRAPLTRGSNQCQLLSDSNCSNKLVPACGWRAALAFRASSMARQTIDPVAPQRQNEAPANRATCSTRLLLFLGMGSKRCSTE